MSCLAKSSLLYKHNLKTRKATSSVSSSGRSCGRSGYGSSSFSRSRKICPIARGPRKRKRGPKDGWHGLTLKILRYVVEDCGGIVTRREIERAFGLSKRGALYHLKRLREWRLIVMVGRGPSTIYYFVYWSGRNVDHANGWGCDFVRGLRRLGRVRGRVRGSLLRVWFSLVLARERGMALSCGDVARMTGYSRRHVERLLRRLVGLGLAFQLGGRKCRFSKYLACFHEGSLVVHVHKYVKGHGYRRRVLGKVC